jgi:hypothetical protein
MISQRHVALACARERLLETPTEISDARRRQ